MSRIKDLLQRYADKLPDRPPPPPDLPYDETSTPYNLPSGATTPLTEPALSGTVTPSPSTVPSFFRRTPPANSVASIVRSRARLAALEARESDLLTREELRLLTTAIQLKSRDYYGRLNYDQFKEVKDSLLELAYHEDDNDDEKDEEEEDGEEDGGRRRASGRSSGVNEMSSTASVLEEEESGGGGGGGGGGFGVPSSPRASRDALIAASSHPHHPRHLSSPSTSPPPSLLLARIAQAALTKLDFLFRPSVFARFCKDPTGKIAADKVIRYVESRNKAMASRWQMAHYDEDGDGYLEEEELSRALMALLPSIPLMKRIPPQAALCGLCNLRGCSFHASSYLTVCMRKFLFFHAQRSVGGGGGRRVRIRDLLTGSSWLIEFRACLKDKKEGGDEEGGEEGEEEGAGGMRPGDSEEEEDEEEVSLQAGWFSPHRAHALFRIFKALDQQLKGGLSPDEFIRFSPFFPDEESLYSSNAPKTLSRLFVQRLFQEQVYKQLGKKSTPPPPHATASSLPSSLSSSLPSLPALARPSAMQSKGLMMDFSHFLDFCVAWDCRNTEAGLKYFFPIFDLERRGYITVMDIYTLLKDLYVLWQAYGYQEMNLQEVVGEIFDMVKPADPTRITLKDLVDCRLGGVFVMMLSDVLGWHQYENRDS